MEEEDAGAHFEEAVVFKVDLEIQRVPPPGDGCVAGAVEVAWGDAFLAKRIRQVFILQGFRLLMLT